MKNTLTLSKVLLYFEIEFSLRSPLEVWRWHHFSIIIDNIKNRFVVYVDHIPLPANYLKGKQHKESTPLKESQNNNKSTYIFLRILFSRKIVVYYQIISEATRRKFRKILSNITSWRSAMRLKKTSIKGIFLRFC